MSTSDAWRDLALCRGATDAFFLGSGAPSEKIEQAKQTCARCPVIDSCREYALTGPYVEAGIWAGLTTADIRDERARRGLGLVR